MLRLAKKKAAVYNCPSQYILENCMKMPFGDENFDSVISNGSLYEWENPVETFKEIYHVLRPGGGYCITDLRRDVNTLKKALVYYSTRPKEIRQGLITSLNAAYTISEISGLLHHSDLRNTKVTSDFFGLCISGEK